MSRTKVRNSRLLTPAWKLGSKPEATMTSKWLDQLMWAGEGAVDGGACTSHLSADAVRLLHQQAAASNSSVQGVMPGMSAPANKLCWATWATASPALPTLVDQSYSRESSVAGAWSLWAMAELS
ncbi:hypothetical protein O1611_g3092 [Lasiodiplodia mahajangana]|uniref:Uncharacterized protein n=1 Tax=Lasiodiplodia mahajangana TaxID=1108764 RepID=A0ACC2JSQ9_9PEZI|nr:hypothetical protein O1611_g3092 [Lasiodiplodia mahajangana]